MLAVLMVTSSVTLDRLNFPSLSLLISKVRAKLISMNCSKFNVMHWQNSQGSQKRQDWASSAWTPQHLSPACTPFSGLHAHHSCYRRKCLFLSHRICGPLTSENLNLSTPNDCISKAPQAHRQLFPSLSLPILAHCKEQRGTDPPRDGLRPQAHHTV